MYQFARIRLSKFQPNCAMFEIIRIICRNLPLSLVCTLQFAKSVRLSTREKAAIGRDVGRTNSSFTSQRRVDDGRGQVNGCNDCRSSADDERNRIRNEYVARYQVCASSSIRNRDCSCFPVVSGVESSCDSTRNSSAA